MMLASVAALPVPTTTELRAPSRTASEIAAQVAAARASSNTKMNSRKIKGASIAISTMA